MNAELQTASLVRGEHSFVFRYEKTPFGLGVLLAVLHRKEREEPDHWSPLDTYCISQSVVDNQIHLAVKGTA